MKQSIWCLAIAGLVVAAPAVSDAQPAPTCKAMCQRFTDCKMSGYTDKCLAYCKQQGYEASEAGRAELVKGAQSSCQQIQQIASAVQNALDQRQRASTHTPSPRTSTRAGTGDNCAPVCDRFEQCRLWKRDSCMSYCAANTTDPAKNLTASQWSCPKLGTWMQELGVSSSGGGWACTAEASLGTANGYAPMVYRNISANGNGANRGAASVKALKDCGALVAPH